jgi:ribonuclease BN (tRNA processing enzyme)
MDLVVAGAGPAYSARPGAVGAAYVLLEDGHAIVLDLGHGAYAGLAQVVEPSTLDAVIVSHLHPDHFVDLVPLRHYLRYEFEPPRRVRVIAPVGLDRRLDDLHAEPGFSAVTLDVEVLTEGQLMVGPFAVEARRITHTDDSYAFRVSASARPEAPALVYSGDCGRGDDLVPLIRPGDMHLDAVVAARVATATGTGRLLLTHVLGTYDFAAVAAVARAGYAGDVRIVVPGDRIRI